MMPLIIVPCHNESAAIGDVVRDLRTRFAKHEILVIDDASTDASAAVARAAGAMVISHPCNLGYLKTLQTGLHAAIRLGRDIAIFFDGDGQHRAEDVPGAMLALEEQGVDLVIGSRFLDPTYSYHGSGTRRAGMIFFSFMLRILTGVRITDTTSGFKVIAQRLMPDLAVGNYADLHAEAILDLLLRGCRVAEHPIVVRERAHGESMYGLVDAILYPLRVLILIAIVLVGRGIGGGRS
jgi:glycosyltransferase involved in cell wall biosynthesis